LGTGYLGHGLRRYNVGFSISGSCVKNLEKARIHVIHVTQNLGKSRIHVIHVTQNLGKIKDQYNTCNTQNLGKIKDTCNTCNTELGKNQGYMLYM
jgi:hypothetical protein